MNEYAIHITGQSVVLRWFHKTAEGARKEAEARGHRVESVRFVRSDCPPICPGVVCRCDEPEIRTCPAHGKKK